MSKSLLLPTKPVIIGETESPSISTLLNQRAKEMIKDEFLKNSDSDSFRVPLTPVRIIESKDLVDVKSVKQKIFFSYFSDNDSILQNVSLDFYPETTFECCLFSMYIMKNGLNDSVIEVLNKRPDLIVFTYIEIFDAKFRPHLKSVRVEELEFEGDSVVYDGELIHCIDMATKLHGSPALELVIDYIRLNPELFQSPDE